MHKFFLLVVAIAMVSAVGCSGSDATQEQSVVTTTKTVSVDTSTPVGAVTKFLEAVRTGNSTVASASLTPLALEQIKQNEMDFTPPASETASFRIGEFELFEADKAFVDTVWVEKDADGKTFEEAMTWGLKLVDGQWRISGMAALVGPDQPPVVFDFENPDQFIGVQDAAPAGAQDNTPRQAQQPSQDPFNQPISR